MFQLDLVNVNWYISSSELCQSTRMVEVKMANDHHLHVLDAVASFLDGLVEVVLRNVVNSLKKIVERRTPHLRIIRTCTSFEEDETLSWVFNKDCYQYTLPPYMAWIGIDAVEAPAPLIKKASSSST